MLELQHISWTAPGGSQVVRDVSFSVPEGKLTVITGPNGGGKTTLAKLIAGIETPDSGKILLDGQDIIPLDVTQRARAGVSFAFQQPVRFKGFTVRRLLELAAGKPLPASGVCEMLGRVGLCSAPRCEGGRPRLRSAATRAGPGPGPGAGCWQQAARFVWFFPAWQSGAFPFYLFIYLFIPPPPVLFVFAYEKKAHTRSDKSISC